MQSPSVELYRSETVAFGTWRCAPTHPAFPGGHMTNPTVAFPRTSVTIDQKGRGTVVTDASVGVVYPPDQDYERFEVDPRGDSCEWFEVAPSVFESMGGLWPEKPSVRTAPRTYAFQRTITTTFDLSSGDPMGLEESVLRLFSLVLDDGVDRSSRPSMRHRSIVEEARAFIASRFADRISLSEIAGAVGWSPYHLSRVFRAVTGETVQRHLTDIRLRRAMDLLGDTDWGLADIAVEVGFSSHSHMTKNFRERFGMTPSAFRSGRHSASSKIVTASP